MICFSLDQCLKSYKLQVHSRDVRIITDEKPGHPTLYKIPQYFFNETQWKEADGIHVSSSCTYVCK